MRRHTLLIYPDTTARSRRRLIHWNGLIVAASSQSYTRRIDARTNARQATLYHLRPGIKVVTES